MIYRFYDWDDTLVLSKEALFLSYQKALAIWDITFEYQYFVDYIYKDSTSFLKDLHFLDNEIKHVKELKEKYYKEDFFDKVIFKFPKFNKNDKYFIITNTNKELVKYFIKKKFDVEYTDMFEDIIGLDINTKRKPSPDLYIKAFNKVRNNWKTSDELHIYEDSVVGLKAAVKFIEMYERRIKNFKIHHVKH